MSLVQCSGIALLEPAVNATVEALDIAEAGVGHDLGRDEGEAATGTDGDDLPLGEGDQFFKLGLQMGDVGVELFGARKVVD